MKTLKKIIKIMCMSGLFISTLSMVAFGIIIEPEIKIKGWEQLDETKLIQAHNTITLLDSKGDIINDYCYGASIYTPIEKINTNTINAFISIEDKRFYSHNGIDYIRIASATKNNIISGSYKEGASTITQQLIKNTHLTNEKKIIRKLKEMRIAIDLERKYLKNEILEMYLNEIYFGGNIYGIGSASKILFDKEPLDLSLSECALLAGIINNPHRYSPYFNLENAISRRNIVLKRMYENNKINRYEYEKAIEEEISIAPPSDEMIQYYFNVIKEAAKILGITTKELYLKNLIIGTSLDTNRQNAVQNMLNNSGMSDITLSQVCIINNLTGSISSICANTRQNLAYTKRQPGSVIKPILSYAPALENNIVVPITPIEDIKTDFNGYSPSNYKNRYDGWTSVQNSLINSSNVCAVKLLEKTGILTAKNYAEKCGYIFNKNDNSLAIALGGLTDGVTLKQIANSYQVFANDGKYIEGSCINYITDSTGNLIYKRQPTQTRVFSPETAFYINDMLLSCAKEGTAKLINESDICAKTGTVGTSEGNTDAYCIAYNPEYTVAIWCGTKDSSQKTNINGGGQPTLLAKKIFASILKSPSSEFNRPETIIEVDIDISAYNSSHKLLIASEDIPQKNRVRAYFTSLTRPNEYSFLYSQNNNSDEILSELDTKNFEIN